MSAVKMSKGEMLGLWAALTQNGGKYLDVQNVGFQYACKRTMEKLRPEIKILGEILSPMEEDYEEEGKTLHRVKPDKIKEHADFLNTEVEIDIHTVPVDKLPEGLNGYIVNGIYKMITE